MRSAALDWKSRGWRFDTFSSHFPLNRMEQPARKSCKKLFQRDKSSSRWFWKIPGIVLAKWFYKGNYLSAMCRKGIRFSISLNRSASVATDWRVIWGVVKGRKSMYKSCQPENMAYGNGHKLNSLWFAGRRAYIAIHHPQVCPCGISRLLRWGEIKEGALAYGTFAIVCYQYWNQVSGLTWWVNTRYWLAPHSPCGQKMGVG